MRHCQWRIFKGQNEMLMFREYQYLKTHIGLRGVHVLRLYQTKRRVANAISVPDLCCCQI